MSISCLYLESTRIMSDKKFLLIIVTFSIIILVGVVIFRDKIQEPPKELFGQEYEDEGKDHLLTDQSPPTYKTNPPVSGSHDSSPAEWGFYEQELPDTRVIHNLEHGGIWVSYQPNTLTNEEINQLKELASKYNQRLIVTPRAKNDSKIAIASWRRLEKLDKLDLELINDFLTTNVNQSPEEVAR